MATYNILRHRTVTAGAGISITESGKDLTISGGGASGVLEDAFSVVAVDGASRTLKDTAGTTTADWATVGAITMAEAKNLVVGTVTGTKIGTAVTQKLAFWNVTPVVQPASAAQAAAAAQSQTSLTDSSTGIASTTLAALSNLSTGDVYTDASVNAKLLVIRNAIASLAAELALAKTDVANVKTLQDATRTALVSTGMMKGAA